MTENQTVWKSNNQGVKEDTFIQTGRRGGDTQLGREDSQQNGSWWTPQGSGWQNLRSHIRVQINQEEQSGSETDCATPGLQLRENPLGVEMAAEETPRPTGEVVGETHRGLESTQAHPHGNQHQKGPLSLWVEGEVTESWQRMEQVTLFPLRPPPHLRQYSTVRWVVLPR